VDKGKLLESISRPHASQSNLEVLISRLRRKLHEHFDNPPQIIPLYGAGYMIDCAISN
jgi:DNA-binding response OmpR family regulator